MRFGKSHEPHDPRSARRIPFAARSPLCGHSRCLPALGATLVEGVPSESFTAIEQLCHVRDIEVEGYHVRFRRTLEESHPTLASIDSEPLAIARAYGMADAAKVLAEFRIARARTMEIVSNLTDVQLARTAVFEGYGPLTMRSLVHYLCSHDQQHLAGLQWLAGKIDASKAAVAA